MYNDNGDGTLTIVGEADPDDKSFQPCVISQTSTSRNLYLEGSSVIPISNELQLQRPLDVSDSDVSDADVSDAEVRVSDAGTETLETVLAASETWKTFELLVKQMGGREDWLTSNTDLEKVERQALIQLVSLPARNNIEEEWFQGITNAHHKRFKRLICVLIAIVGIKGPCQVCKTRKPEKQSHCAALPPQAAKMEALQKLLRNRCSECYHASTKKPCGFPFKAHKAIEQKSVPTPRPEGSVTAQKSPIQKDGPEPPGPSAPPVSDSSPSPPQRVFKELVRPSALPSTIVIPLQAENQHQSSHRQNSTTNARTMAQKETSKMPERENPADTCSAGVSTLSAADLSGSSSTVQAHEVLDKQSTRETSGNNSDPARPHSSSWTLVSKTLGLLTEVSNLASQEQGDIYDRIVDVIEVIRRPLQAPQVPDKQRSRGASGNESDSAHPHPLSPTLVSKALGLLTEVSNLASQEQWEIYGRIVDVIEVIRRPLEVGRKRQVCDPVAEQWESASGRLTVAPTVAAQEAQIAFSTSYLHREIIDVELATEISHGQKAVNRQIPALQQVTVKPFDARWHCTLTVLEGLVQVKMGQMEAKIGQGGIFIIGQDSRCLLTNITLRDCRVQIRWVER